MIADVRGGRIRVIVSHKISVIGEPDAAAGVTPAALGSCPGDQGGRFAPSGFGFELTTVFADDLGGVAVW